MTATYLAMSILWEMGRLLGQSTCCRYPKLPTRAAGLSPEVYNNAKGRRRRSVSAAACFGMWCCCPAPHVEGTARSSAAPVGKATGFLRRVRASGIAIHSRFLRPFESYSWRHRRLLPLCSEGRPQCAKTRIPEALPMAASGSIWPRSTGTAKPNSTRCRPYPTQLRHGPLARPRSK